MEREEQQGQPAVTPEQRAALEARLKRWWRRSPIATCATHYERELRQTLWAKNRKLEGAGARPRPAPSRTSPASAATILSSTGACASGPTSGHGSAARRGRPLRPAASARSNELSERAALRAAARGPADRRPHQPSLAARKPLRGHRQADADLARLCNVCGMPCSPFCPRGSPLITQAYAPISAPVGLTASLPRLSGQWRTPATSLRVLRQVPARPRRAGATPWRCMRPRWRCRWSCRSPSAAWTRDQSEEAWERIVELQDRLARWTPQERCRTLLNRCSVLARVRVEWNLATRCTRE